MLHALQARLVIKVNYCFNGALSLRRQGGRFKPYTSLLGFKQGNMYVTLEAQKENDTIIFSGCLKNFEKKLHLYVARNLEGIG